MPRFEVRLESQTDHHFRVTRLDADDADAARAFCERSEYATCAYRLDDKRLAEAREIDAAPGKVLQGQLKGLLHAHLQDTPYKVVSVTEIKGR